MRKTVQNTLTALALVSLCGCGGYTGQTPTDSCYASTTPAPAVVRVSNEVANHSTEIARLQARIDQLEDQLSEHQDTEADTSGNLHAAVEQAHTQISAHEERAQEQLQAMRMELAKMQQESTVQEDEVRKLETAMRTMVSAMQESEAKKSGDVAMVDAPKQASHFYTVKAGDTLGAIAKKHSTSVQDIKTLNNIEKEDLIFAGQQLAIP